APSSLSPGEVNAQVGQSRAVMGPASPHTRQIVPTALTCLATDRLPCLGGAATVLLKARRDLTGFESQIFPNPVRWQNTGLSLRVPPRTRQPEAPRQIPDSDEFLAHFVTSSMKSVRLHASPSTRTPRACQGLSSVSLYALDLSSTVF